MDYESLKKHYGVYSSTNPPKSFTIGNVLFMFRWGEGLWDSINIKEECTTYWIKAGSIKNLKGVKIYQLIIGRLSITWGKIYG